MRKIHKGTTIKAANFSKSLVSFDMTPILKQSPLYLSIKIFYMRWQIEIWNATKETESILGIDKSQSEHNDNSPSKNWVGHSQWENVFLLGTWILGQISLFSQCDSKFSAISLCKQIRGQKTQVVKDKALFCDCHFVSSLPLITLWPTTPNHLWDEGQIVIEKDNDCLPLLHTTFLYH